MWFADETGVYFHTGSTKKVYKQLKENPKIEVCFYNPGSTPDAGKMLRITGEVEFLNDAKLQERLMSERPFLQDLRKARPDVEVVIFRIFKGVAHFWTMMDNLDEENIPVVQFEKA